MPTGIQEDLENKAKAQEQLLDFIRKYNHHLMPDGHWERLQADI